MRSLGFLILLFLPAFLSASDRLFIETDREIYSTGDQIHFSVRRFKEDSFQLTVGNRKTLVDLVAPNGTVVMQLLFDENSVISHFEIPNATSSGFYRIVANAEGAQPSVKTIRVISLLKTPSGTENTPNLGSVKLFVVGKALISGIPTKLVIRTLSEKGTGVPTLCSVFGERDSLLTYVQTDKNGVGTFSVQNSGTIYTVKAGKFVDNVTISHQSNVGMDVTQVENTVKVTWFSSEKSDLQLYSVSIIQKEVKQKRTASALFSQTKEVVLETETLLPGRFAIQLDSAGIEVQRFELFKNAKTNESDIQTNLTPFASDSLMLKLTGLDSYSSVSVTVADKSHPGTTSAPFYESALIYQQNPALYPISTAQLPLYLATGMFDETLPKTYKPPFPESFNPCSSGESSVSVLELSTLKAVDINCQDWSGPQSLTPFITAPSGKVWVYSFGKGFRPLKQLAGLDAKSFRYPELMLDWQNDAQLSQLTEMLRKAKLIEAAFETTSEPELKLQPPIAQYSFDEFNLPSSMSGVLNQMVYYASVSYNVVEKRSHVRLYPQAKSYKYSYGPLILINELPTFDEQVLFNLDPRTIERLEIRNTFDTFKQFGRFGQNGILSITLRQGVQNPLQEQILKLPTVRGSKDGKTTSTSTIEIKPVLVHKRMDSPDEKATVTFKKSLLDTEWTLQILGISKTGRVVEFSKPLFQNQKTKN